MTGYTYLLYFEDTSTACPCLSLQYGRMALEAVMKSVLDMQTDAHGVAPPKSYEGDFFKGLYIQIFLRGGWGWSLLLIKIS